MLWCSKLSRIKSLCLVSPAIKRDRQDRQSAVWQTLMDLREASRTHDVDQAVWARAKQKPHERVNKQTVFEMGKNAAIGRAVATLALDPACCRRN